MKSIFTTTALASAIVVGGIFAASPSFAQDNQPCVGENCPPADMQKGTGQGDEQMAPNKKKKNQGTESNTESGDQIVKPRKKRAQGTQQQEDVDVNVQVGSQQRVGQSDSKFDPNRHQRRRSKSATFPFYFGGYWYQQPYWEIYGVRRNRVSCGEGRAIVAERFNRVRVVECRGPTYTYLGRRQGDTFRILLNARNGRIVGRALI
jgi:hypothetical protein